MENSKEERVRLLVIEDEKPLADILEYNFKKEGYEVKSVYNGLDGISITGEYRPQIILLDWMLPDMSGVDGVRFIFGGR